MKWALEGLSELKPGWYDGWGEAPTAKALTAAREWIRFFPRPHATADPDSGGVSFEWWKDDWSLCLHFDAEGRTWAYCLTHDKDGFRDEEGLGALCRRLGVRA